MLRALLLGPLLVCGLGAQTGALRPATEDEKQVVLEMSKARLHPREYARWLETQLQYFEGTLWNLPDRIPLQTEEGAAALEELIAFLKTSSLSLGPLRWSEGLARAARQLAQEQGPTGQTGHRGPGGSTLQSRALKQGLFQSQLVEVIDYGPEKPRWIVVQLLIDDGVPGRDHRNAIFSPSFHAAGAAIGPHTVHGEMTVVDLADAFVETPGGKGP